MCTGFHSCNILTKMNWNINTQSNVASGGKWSIYFFQLLGVHQFFFIIKESSDQKSLGNSATSKILTYIVMKSGCNQYFWSKDWKYFHFTWKHSKFGWFNQNFWLIFSSIDFFHFWCFLTIFNGFWHFLNLLIIF